MTIAFARLRTSVRTSARTSAHAPHDLDVVVAGSIAAAAVGVTTALVGPMVPFALGISAVFVLIALRPALAAYLYVAALPFVTGIERGAIVPLLRPNEALQVFVTAAVLAGVGARVVAQSAQLRVRITRLDRAIALLAVLGSVWPVAWLLIRGHDPTAADLYSSLVLWRLFALYALFRYVVRTPEQLRRLLWTILVGACALGAIALLQGRGLASLSFLGSDAPEGRGRATLSSSIAVGDYLAYSLALALGLHLRHRVPGRIVTAMCVVLLVGSLATGQFSAWIGALIALIAVAAHGRQLMSMAVRVLPAAPLALLAAWPMVGRRFAGFGDATGIPSSWLGRLDNLREFYLPQLGGFRWVLGVRPDPVLPAPETWREVIYLESGLLWLLWVGGVPLLIAFLWFLWAAFIHAHRVATSRTDDLGAVALAVWASLCVMAVLTIIDMHLTLRGGGDLLFILLGLSASRWFAAPGGTALLRGEPSADLSEECSS